MTATLGIFVGGASSRMGVPKGRLVVPGTGHTIVEHLVRIGESLHLPVVLVGDAAPYADLATHVPRLADASEGEGPLRGFAALFAHVAVGPVVALACDMPHVSAADVRLLLALPDGPVAYAARRHDDAPWEPFFARYDAARALVAVRATLAAGQHSLQAALARMHPVRVNARPEALSDWDTPADRA